MVGLPNREIRSLKFDARHKEEGRGGRELPVSVLPRPCIGGRRIMLTFGVRKGFLPRRRIDMEVSVIIPVYNKFDYLETCLRSVLDQEMDDFEVVAVDDGSTDGSGEICDRLAAEYTRLRVIHVANGGVTRARRVAFNASSGRYVTFVDADDRMLPGGLKTLYESIERVGSDEVIATYVDNSGRLCDSGMRGLSTRMC